MFRARLARPVRQDLLALRGLLVRQALRELLAQRAPLVRPGRPAVSAPPALPVQRDPGA